MPNLGNAWHLPQNAEPRGRGAMLDPVDLIPAGARATIVSRNQYQGGGNLGNQLQDSSAVLFRRATDPDWTVEPLLSSPGPRGTTSTSPPPSPARSRSA